MNFIRNFKFLSYGAGTGTMCALMTSSHAEMRYERYNKEIKRIKSHYSKTYTGDNSKDENLVINLILGCYQEFAANLFVNFIKFINDENKTERIEKMFDEYVKKNI
jgi:hypothetical protein